MRDIGSLTNHIKRGAIVIADLLVGYLSMEVHIVRQDKDLLDIVSRNRGTFPMRIIPADIDHFPYDGTYKEERRAVHTGNRIIDDDNLVLKFRHISLLHDVHFHQKFE